MVVTVLWGGSGCSVDKTGMSSGSAGQGGGGGVKTSTTSDAAVQGGSGRYRVDVGSPHWVEPVDDVFAPAVAERGQRRCTGERAVNATFFSVVSGGSLRVRTLERGVPAETRSCGTGALAAFLVARRVAPGVVGERARITFASGEQLEVVSSGGGRCLAVGGKVSSWRHPTHGSSPGSEQRVGR